MELASCHVSIMFGPISRFGGIECPTDAQVRRISWHFVGSASLGADRCLLNTVPGWPPPIFPDDEKAPSGAFVFVSLMR